MERGRSQIERLQLKSSAGDDVLKAAIINGLLFEKQSLGAAGQVEVSSGSSWTGQNVVQEHCRSQEAAAAAQAVTGAAVAGTGAIAGTPSCPKVSVGPGPEPLS